MLFSFRNACQTLALAGAFAFTTCIMSTNALAQLDPADRQFLIDLYEATDGENWRINQSWLGPEGTECTWHGVQCLGQGDRFLLILPNNFMMGNLPDSIIGADGLVALTIPDNAITGSLIIESGELPNLIALVLDNNQLTAFEIESGAAPLLQDVRFANNLLEGVFPPGLEGLSDLEDIDLSFNSFSGELPTWLGDFQLKRLRLAGNNFSGSIMPALEAMRTDLEPDDLGGLDSIQALPALLDLRGNAFGGQLDAEILNYTHNIPEWIDLCWNLLEIADPAVQTWLEEEHRGSSVEYCLGHTISDPPLMASGSWFNPERAGEGFSIMLLDDGQTLVHWFTYAQAIEPSPRQSWLIGNDILNNFGFEELFVYGPEGGQFGQGLPNPQSFPYDVLGSLTLAWTDEQRFESDQEVTDGATLQTTRQQIGLTQLTRLAGTTCDTQTEFQGLSGAWFNPERAGEGFVVEVLPDDRVVVYWFSYAPDGSGLQAWLTGDSRFEGGSLQEGFETSVPLYETAGTYFGEDFNAEDVELIPWGSLDLRFETEDSGEVSWNGPEGFGSGGYPITRLARPMLAECD